MTLALSPDFDKQPSSTQKFWKALDGSRIFLAGGTGFFGASILEGLIWAKHTFKLHFELVVLSRNSDAFLARWPIFRSFPWITFHPGDVKSFEFPSGPFTHVLHGASSVAQANDSELTQEALAQGTKRLLEFAKHAGAQRFLYVSSGAIYGKQPPHLSHIPETFSPTPTSFYGQGKLQGEALCLEQAEALQPIIARCFAFVGPYLPLDSHFAIGNFLRDAIEGKSISISGDGTAHRSYLYSADLVPQLIGLLTHGRAGEAYNVGSKNAISIRDLAQTVVNIVNPKLDVNVALSPSDRPPEKYIPATNKIEGELNLTQLFSLEESILRTAYFYRSFKN